MDDVLTVTVRTNDAEQKRLSKRLRKYRPKAVRQRFLIVGSVVWLLVCVLMGVFFYYLPRGVDGVYDACFAYADDWEACATLLDDSVDGLSFALYALLGVFVLLVWYLVWLYGSGLRANFRSLNGRVFVYEISEEGFVSHEVGVARAQYSWAGVMRVVRDERYLLVFVDQGAAYAMPWHAFADAAAGEAFATQAQAWHSATGAKGK